MSNYISRKESQRLQELASKPSDYRFSADEKALIRRKVLRDYEILWATVKKPRTLGAVVYAIYDGGDPNKRSKIWQQWDIVCRTKPEGIELDEIIENYGINNRIFQVWNYHSIDRLNYIVQTHYKPQIVPAKFIEHCKKLGYSTAFQSQLNFDLS